MNEYTKTAMNQGQRVRYLKTGGIIFFIVLVLYFFVPRDALPTSTFYMLENIADIITDSRMQMGSLKRLEAVTLRCQERKQQSAKFHIQRISHLSSTP
jgi:hypothetical protein